MRPALRGGRAALEAKGQPIGSLDTLIAAHGLALVVIVVTHHKREFGRVDGLRIEDWLGDVKPPKPGSKSRR
jgi:tRNA(fMet)-specific endonuclease VapC